MSNLASLRPSHVLTTSEAREQVPALAQRFREQGADAEIVFFGPHRRAAGAIVPIALLEELAPLIEDLLVARRVRERLATDSGQRVSLERLDSRLAITPEELQQARRDLLSEHELEG
jgi:antitoxin StbD